MSVLALILARGGSKGVPGKNIIDMLGRPLIAWTIEQGLQSKLVDRVIVSTDSEEIRDVAIAWGAEAPFLRPTEIAQDLSTDHEGFAHALNWLAENENSVPELVVHLRATGPVRDVAKIDEAIRLMQTDPQATALRSIELAELSPYKMWQHHDGDQYLTPLVTVDGVTDCQSKPRQMLPQCYWQNGYVDVVRSSTILQGQSMTGDRVIPFLIDDKVADIDYPGDIPRVEAALREYLESGGRIDRKPSDRHSV